MATRTGLSTKTIEFHKAAIYERLDMRTTAALVRYALKNGLLADGDIGPLPRVFRLVYCCNEMDGSVAVAHVRAAGRLEATAKLQARFGHLKDFAIKGISEA